MIKQTLTIMAIFIAVESYPQANWQKNGNNASGGAATTCGTATAWNAPFQLITQGAIRLHINENLGGPGTNTGFIGMGTTNPLFRLHIDATGTGDATALGWNKGLLLSNQAITMWQGSPFTGFNFFMGHAPHSFLVVIFMRELQRVLGQRHR